ncbi:PREDICTED: arf-GAP with dual PH domain-containing protein 1 [Myotis brandtii]|uniref:arf-GAP with dual PH domain-containing protein 1 n=1 Tax=Myotis brandtii TaxID=109478 RepID=UPI000703CCE0|nr:PREDICTED: arf-GAP with dual PH domain-containing protein 1 [Myotis brandtii]
MPGHSSVRPAVPSAAFSLPTACRPPHPPPDPDWASYTLGVFICLSCSAIHRNIPEVSKVKSVRLDAWEEAQVEGVVPTLRTEKGTDSQQTPFLGDQLDLTRHHSLTTTESPPRSHRHGVTTTESPPRSLCHRVTTTQSPPWSLHHGVSTTESPPRSHHHGVSTTESPPRSLCHRVTTTESPPRSLHHGLTTTESPPRSHHHGVITTESPPWSLRHGVSTTESPPRSHHHGVSTTESPPRPHHHSLTATEPRPLPPGYREGFLWKRGRDNGQFLSRKFVLTEREGALKYFNRHDAKEPKAIMKIEHLNATFQPAKIGHPHGLQVTYLKDNSTRNIFIYHEDGKEMADWFNALRAARFHYLQVAFPGASDADLVPKLTRNYLKEGYMEKTGPKQTEGFRRRWFTMDDRRLMYFKDPLVGQGLGRAEGPLSQGRVLGMAGEGERTLPAPEVPIPEGQSVGPSLEPGLTH